VPTYDGLLDDFPGAAAAYSLRKLDRDYAGYAIRVRRASDNTEQDIGFNASRGLDTSALATFCSGTDGFVKTWYDQSGNGNDATQTTLGYQPKIYDSSTGVIEEGSSGNEKPAVEFDGTNDHFTKAFTLTNPVSHFVVAQASSVGDIVIDGYGNNNRNSLYTTSATEIRLSNTTSLYQTRINGAQAVFSSISNGASSLLAVNGSSATGTLGTASMDGVTIGTFGTIILSFCLNGTMQEIVLYGSDQTSNRTGIEDNINDYYSIY